MEGKEHTVVKLLTGAVGTATSFTLHDTSLLIASLSGLATLVYMILQIIKTWRSLNRPRKDFDDPTTK